MEKQNKQLLRKKCLYNFWFNATVYMIVVVRILKTHLLKKKTTDSISI